MFRFHATTAMAALMMVGMVGVPAATDAQIKQQGKKYLMRIKWQKGKQYDYSMKTSIQIPGMSAAPEPMAVDYTMKVASVSNGKAVVNVISQGNTQKMTIDSRGKTSGGDAGAMFSSDMSQLPAKAVAIDETWVSNSKMDGPTGSMNVKATSKLVGFKTVAGKKMAHVNVKMNLSGGGATGTGNGDILYVMSDGMTYRATIKMDMSMTNPGGGPKMKVKATTLINRR